MNQELNNTIFRMAVQYYDHVKINPTQEDFLLWINSLKEPMKSDFSKKSLNDCKTILNFKRFILELNGYGMDEYMKANLSEKDYNSYMKQL